jgi:hypothetical protein
MVGAEASQQRANAVMIAVKKLKLQEEQVRVNKLKLQEKAAQAKRAVDAIVPKRASQPLKPVQAAGPTPQVVQQVAVATSENLHAGAGPVVEYVEELEPITETPVPSADDAPVVYVAGGQRYRLKKTIEMRRGSSAAATATLTTTKALTTTKEVDKSETNPPKAKTGVVCGNGKDGKTETLAASCGECPGPYANWCSGDCALKENGLCENQIVEGLKLHIKRPIFSPLPPQKDEDMSLSEAKKRLYKTQPGLVKDIGSGVFGGQLLSEMLTPEERAALKINTLEGKHKFKPNPTTQGRVLRTQNAIPKMNKMMEAEVPGTVSASNIGGPGPNPFTSAKASVKGLKAAPATVMTEETEASTEHSSSASAKQTPIAPQHSEQQMPVQNNEVDELTALTDELNEEAAEQDEMTLLPQPASVPKAELKAAAQESGNELAALSHKLK